MGIEAGQKAVEFCLPDSDGNNVCLKDFLGSWVVLYFYPKDDTPGCTLEAVTFSRQLAAFVDKETVILGVSPDTKESHCRFRDKHDLKITLLSDVDKEVLKSYGVWVLKKMYGKEYYGVERSTFIIDPNGVVVRSWRKVKVKGHVEDVLRSLEESRSL